MYDENTHKCDIFSFVGFSSIIQKRGKKKNKYIKIYKQTHTDKQNKHTATTKTQKEKEEKNPLNNAILISLLPTFYD